jgi:hypothetical protein
LACKLQTLILKVELIYKLLLVVEKGERVQDHIEHNTIPESA